MTRNFRDCCLGYAFSFQMFNYLIVYRVIFQQNTQILLASAEANLFQDTLVIISNLVELNLFQKIQKFQAACQKIR